MLDYVANEAYKGLYLTAQCLPTSYKIFYRVGFDCYGIQHWKKQGTTYVMKRDPKKNGG